MDSSIIAVLEAAWTCSYKKDDEPLLNLTGAMSRCSREKVLLCTQKTEGTFVYTKDVIGVPSLNSGGLLCTL